VSVPATVLDSWALLAWLRSEQPAAAEVEATLDAGERGDRRVLLCLLNAGEVVYILARDLGDEEAAFVRDSFALLPVEMCPIDEELVWEAAGVKARHSLSYADAFAVACALRFDAELATGDPEIVALRDLDGLRVHALRRGR
jgi:ribonuclease VapC